MGTGLAIVDAAFLQLESPVLGGGLGLGDDGLLAQDVDGGSGNIDLVG